MDGHQDYLGSTIQSYVHGGSHWDVSWAACNAICASCSKRTVSIPIANHSSLRAAVKSFWRWPGPLGCKLSVHWIHSRLASRTEGESDGPTCSTWSARNSASLWDGQRVKLRGGCGALNGRPKAGANRGEDGVGYSGKGQI